jgi:hypothetical protein
MSANLPLHLDHATNVHLARRVELALKAELATVAYGFPQYSIDILRFAIGMEATRAGHRWMDEAQGIPELVPDEFEGGLARGTQETKVVP